MSEFPISLGVKSLIAADANSNNYAIEIGGLPNSPDAVIAIADTGGLPANPAWLLDFPAVQVTVRGTIGGYQSAWQQCKNIKDLLVGLPSQDINGDRWVSVLMATDVAFIGRDKNQRPIFTLNLNFIIEPQTNANTNRTAINDE